MYNLMMADIAAEMCRVKTSYVETCISSTILIVVFDCILSIRVIQEFSSRKFCMHISAPF
jgi:hypothetical protein